MTQIADPQTIKPRARLVGTQELKVIALMRWREELYKGFSKYLAEDKVLSLLDGKVVIIDGDFSDLQIAELDALMLELARYLGKSGARKVVGA